MTPIEISALAVVGSAEAFRWGKPFSEVGYGHSRRVYGLSTEAVNQKRVALLVLERQAPSDFKRIAEIPSLPFWIGSLRDILGQQDTSRFGDYLEHDRFVVSGEG